MENDETTWFIVDRPVTKAKNKKSKTMIEYEKKRLQFIELMDLMDLVEKTDEETYVYVTETYNFGKKTKNKE